MPTVINHHDVAKLINELVKSNYVSEAERSFLQRAQAIFSPEKKLGTTLSEDAELYFKLIEEANALHTNTSSKIHENLLTIRDIIDSTYTLIKSAIDEQKPKVNTIAAKLIGDAIKDFPSEITKILLKIDHGFQIDKFMCEVLEREIAKGLTSSLRQPQATKALEFIKGVIELQELIIGEQENIETNIGKENKNLYLEKIIKIKSELTILTDDADKALAKIEELNAAIATLIHNVTEEITKDATSLEHQINNSELASKESLLVTFKSLDDVPTPANLKSLLAKLQEIQEKQPDNEFGKINFALSAYLEKYINNIFGETSLDTVRKALKNDKLKGHAYIAEVLKAVKGVEDNLKTNEGNIMNGSVTETPEGGVLNRSIVGAAAPSGGGGEATPLETAVHTVTPPAPAPATGTTPAAATPPATGTTSPAGPRGGGGGAEEERPQEKAASNASIQQFVGKNADVMFYLLLIILALVAPQMAPALMVFGTMSYAGKATQNNNAGSRTYGIAGTIAGAAYGTSCAVGTGLYAVASTIFCGFASVFLGVAAPFEMIASNKNFSETTIAKMWQGNIDIIKAAGEHTKDAFIKEDGLFQSSLRWVKNPEDEKEKLNKKGNEVDASPSASRTQASPPQNPVTVAPRPPLAVPPGTPDAPRGRGR